MKANVQLVQKRRHFSEEFKRTFVKEFESGRFSVDQLSKLHTIQPEVIYNWIYHFSQFNLKGARIVEMHVIQPVSELRKAHPDCGVKSCFFCN